MRETRRSPSHPHPRIPVQARTRQNQPIPEQERIADCRSKCAANRLLRRVRDYAQVRAAGHIDLPTAQAALSMLEVDRHGFDEVDRKLLLTIIEKYQGGPVGVNTLAAALAEEPDAIEEIYEPFLIQIGFLNRTPRGRIATQLAYEHFGITPNRRQSSLF